MKPPFRVIVAGTRSFSDIGRIYATCDRVLTSKSRTHDIVIVSGLAPGPDSIGRSYSADRGYRCAEYPAMWDDLSHPDAVIRTRQDGTKYDAMAGKRRNIRMADNADALIAFWDGRSGGTSHMIKTAKRRKLLVRVIRYI